MILVRKGPPPPALVTFKQTPDTSAEPTRAPRYDGPGFEAVKPAVREALHREQRGLCCYCSSGIAASPEGMKIEHRVPQRGPHGDPSRDLDWANLFGACHGRIAPRAGREVLHCDSAKGDQPIDFDPSNASHVAAVGYQRSGRLCSSRDDHQRELDAVLNLNHEALVERRQKTLDDIKRGLATRYPGRTFPADKLRRLRDEIIAPPAGPLRPFAGYIAWWIDRAIRKSSAA